MPKENENNSHDLIARLEQVCGLLAEVLVLAKSGKTVVAKPMRSVSAKPPTKELDFSKPIRAFIKRYSNGMSGPKKFTLLLAYLAKGDLKKVIALEEIQKQWNKMTAKSLLGMEFNRFYPASAKENDWVNSEKNGSYNLRPAWTAIF